jgi:uncharacterized FAD-dependent dehydrogenase
LVATGRVGANLLVRSGVEPAAGKGVDYGVRIEFFERASVLGLRSLGPDPKIMDGRVRTFCLNCPGRIYYYQQEGMYIPGGVVAPADEPKANFGVLLREANKTRLLKHLKHRIPTSPSEPVLAKGDPLGVSWRALTKLFGTDPVDELLAFCMELGSANLVDWDREHLVHSPLFDWHWPVFADASSFQTKTRGLFVAGDVAGHARGLLQAATSGLLAANEIANAVL